MKTTLILIRHGESEGNKQLIFCGHYNAPLTELGRLQAKLACEYLAANYPISAVYASDLQRASDTVRAVADKLHVPFYPCPGMREIDGGIFEGMPFLQMKEKYPEQARNLWANIKDLTCPEGECTHDLYERVYKTLQEIAAAERGKTVLIGSHATPLRALQCRLDGIPFENIETVPWIPNASLLIIEEENGAFTVKERGIHPYLPEQMTTSPAEDGD